MEAKQEQVLVEKIKKYINEKYGSLDYFTEKQLLDYCLGKAKENEPSGKPYKVENINCAGIIKYLQIKHCMSYDLIAESANRLATQYSRLAKNSNSSGSKTSTQNYIEETNAGKIIETNLNLHLLNGNIGSRLHTDGKTIEYHTIEPVA